MWLNYVPYHLIQAFKLCQKVTVEVTSNSTLREMSYLTALTLYDWGWVLLTHDYETTNVSKEVQHLKGQKLMVSESSRTVSIPAFKVFTW